MSPASACVAEAARTAAAGFAPVIAQISLVDIVFSLDSVFTAVGLVVLNPSYVTVYASALGQTTLALISICWGVALWWLTRMSRFRTPERFLVGGPALVGARK